MKRHGSPLAFELPLPIVNLVSLGGLLQMISSQRRS
jgi:hypothetical protein